jgi:hypothetical protein
LTGSYDPENYDARVVAGSTAWNDQNVSAGNWELD